MTMSKTLLIMSFLAVPLTPSYAQTVDPGKTKAFSDSVAEQLKDLKCTILQGEVNKIKVGLDDSDHKVRSASYTTFPDHDEAKTTITVTCKTGDKATVPASVSDDIDASIKIGKDCKVSDTSFASSGELGKPVIAAAHFLGVFKNPVQQIIDRSKACTPRP